MHMKQQTLKFAAGLADKANLCHGRPVKRKVVSFRLKLKQGHELAAEKGPSLASLNIMSNYCGQSQLKNQAALQLYKWHCNDSCTPSA